MMQVSIAELETDAEKYIELAETQDIFIIKNGERVAKITSAKVDKRAAMKSIFGVIPADADVDTAKAEKLL